MKAREQHQALKLWLRMLGCTTRVENAVRSRLRTAFGITLPRFDLMAQLERQPAGLRMGELSKRMMVTGGNVTGIAGQLEREGLVARAPDPQDGRAFVLKLTPQGQAAFAEMAAVHEDWVAELFSEVPVEDIATMISLLDTMKQRLKDQE
ncbi:MarR family transcriptional regulator [Massilia sp. WF1]|nr:MarR family transcriptional regulator [Massilia sp. WG5]KLU38002.1 MarR family transcriptional regulator [Massilia sp. WF1]